jgi:hypothetical protein
VKPCLFSIIKSILGVKSIGNPVQSTLENAIFAIFRKFQRTFFYAFSENLKMQDVSSILLLQECAVKTDSYWGLTFIGFFEKCAAIIFCMSHFASYISQSHHVCHSKHKFDVKLQISDRKKCVCTKRTPKLGWQL